MCHKNFIFNLKLKHFGYIGFTLIEILIALFIFTIVSMILTAALHNIISLQSRTEQNASRFHELDIAWLLMSRDFEQAVNRPVIDQKGLQQPSFLGLRDSAVFTRDGWANPTAELRSTMQRVRYYVQGKILFREVWRMLDQAPETQSLSRPLLTQIQSLSFEYIDRKHGVYHIWPMSQQQGASSLPQAVRVVIEFTNGRQWSQTYL